MDLGFWVQICGEGWFVGCLCLVIGCLCFSGLLWVGILDDCLAWLTMGWLFVLVGYFVLLVAQGGYFGCYLLLVTLLLVWMVFDLCFLFWGIIVNLLP